VSVRGAGVGSDNGRLSRGAKMVLFWGRQWRRIKEGCGKSMNAARPIVKVMSRVWGKLPLGPMTVEGSGDKYCGHVWESNRTQRILWKPEGIHWNTTRIR
jgi:hypothetical protein